MKTVIYPGSFDPFTNGHLDLIQRACRLFDRVIVAVAVNSGKNPLFTLEERRRLIEESCRSVSGQVEVIATEGLIVNTLKQYNAQALLRGLRAFSDYEYELQMALMNRRLLAGCETIFMTPTLKNSFVSSTLIKEVAFHGGDFSIYVPGPVEKAIRAKFQN
ncbi:MAG: pantetheine-phosphate adenylyltransferase [Victivallaceae bacterium]|nr:pantetheine-phosphate adenylyltransferase [Victivallaceae bacterium]